MARKFLRVVANYDPTYYDMYVDANEACFAQLYLERINRHAGAARIRPPARLLEAGCQTGRLAVPFAKQGFDVTGIDRSGFALRRARQHARAAGVAVRWIRGDVVKVLRRAPRGQYDVVVCAEVLYLSPRYRELLRALAEAVRPGGLLCVSHRPRCYYLWEALRRADLAAALEVMARSEGPFGDSAYYNWQTDGELHALYRSLGFSEVSLYPIDRIAWLTGLSPSQLTAGQRRQWLEGELEWPGHPDGFWGRYVLAVTAKPLERCIA